jgi:hypothetical protein
MAEAEVWLTSTSEESWSAGEEYGSKGEAIAGAAQEHELQPGDTFYVAQRVDYDPRKAGGFAERLIEQARDAAFDECGDEPTEDWLTDVTDVEEQELEDAIGEAFVKWMKDHGHSPSFFVLGKITKHAVPEPASQPLLPGEAAL